MRHKTLLETNEDLIKTVQQFQDAIEDEQANLANHIKVYLKIIDERKKTI